MNITILTTDNYRIYVQEEIRRNCLYINLCREYLDGNGNLVTTVDATWFHHVAPTRFREMLNNPIGATP